MKTAIPQRKWTWKARRGAALTEFALVVPLFVTILFFSMYFVELMRTKLKLQEASRYVAWELTSYMLTDYANADHDQAFNQAMKEAIEEAEERYKDLDSVEPNGKGNFIADNQPIKVTITNQDSPFLNEGAMGKVPGGQLLASGANFALGGITGLWGFNDKGKVTVRVEGEFRNKILQRRFYERDSGGLFSVDQHGGRDLSSIKMSSQYTLVANGWHLPDGAPAQFGKKQAGMHPTGSKSGLKYQVDRMAWLGLKSAFEGIPGLGDALQFAQKWIPGMPTLLFPTYVVSLPYDAEAGETKNCTGVPADTSGASGRNDFTSMGDNPIERPGVNCYDTAPFRDTHAWNSSLYKKMFEARGNHFMGCRQAMADDPTTTQQDYSRKTRDDKNLDPRACNP